MKPLEGKRVLVTGGTGSLGRLLIRRLLAGEMGTPAKVLVFSRDETKQHAMQSEYGNRWFAAPEIVFENAKRLLAWRVGDIRLPESVAAVLREADVVINAAAMKQVPACEYFAYEAVRTNIQGAEHIVRAIETLRLPVEVVVGVSTDKACKPVNTMGMTKAVQERLFIHANLRCPDTRFVCVRYGNVLAARGSIVPLFHEQIRQGGPVTITSTAMTRFLLRLDDAVDTVFAAIQDARRGDTLVPRAPSARVVDLAAALIGDRPVQTVVTGVRPGEKIHEIMVSEEETYRTVERGAKWYAILPVIPELRGDEAVTGTLTEEYSSRNGLMTREQTRTLLAESKLLVEDAASGTAPVV
jgi:UDP-glucose 4-epimerase